MEKDFTPKTTSPSTEKGASLYGPKESTLEFLRTFARIYTPGSDLNTSVCFS